MGSWHLTGTACSRKFRPPVAILDEEDGSSHICAGIAKPEAWVAWEPIRSGKQPLVCIYRCVYFDKYLY